VEVVASFSQGRTAAAQCGLFTHKSVPVIFEPPCSSEVITACCCNYCLPTLSEVYNDLRRCSVLYRRHVVFISPTPQ